uniref:Uncharacterized protein n=1 Tax=Arundo donax TaxID=35708 RepID=A0A0A9G5K1_ARUDO
MHAPPSPDPSARVPDRPHAENLHYLIKPPEQDDNDASSCAAAASGQINHHWRWDKVQMAKHDHALDCISSSRSTRSSGMVSPGCSSPSPSNQPAGDSHVRVTLASGDQTTGPELGRNRKVRGAADTMEKLPWCSGAWRPIQASFYNHITDVDNVRLRKRGSNKEENSYKAGEREREVGRLLPEARGEIYQDLQQHFSASK